MKTVMRLAALCTFCTICTFCLAQSKPADPPTTTGDHETTGSYHAIPPAPPAKIPLAPSIVKDELWVAVHKRDMAQKQMSDLNAQLMQIQGQATQKMQTLQGQQKQAEVDIEAAKAKAYAAAKLDPAKYDFDLETMEFSAKAASEAKK
jgi:hypothetical protein